MWFLSLPFVAVLIALGCQRWLPYVAVASVNLWITAPHHYATWVRTYGMPEVWQRFKERLLVGPVVILLGTIVGLIYAPITLLLLVTAWDHQHSIMQQHGLSRVYDFKAKAGMPSTGRYDFALHWVLYSHMFLNAPMFRFLWVRELHRMGHGPGQESSSLVDGIPGGGPYHHVSASAIDEGQGGGEDRFLRSCGRDHLRVRVHFHAEPPMHVAGNRPPQRRQPAGGRVLRDLGDRSLQCRGDELRSRLPRVSDREIDDPLTRGTQCPRLLL